MAGDIGPGVRQRRLAGFHREVFRIIFQADVDLVMQGAVKNNVIAYEIDRTIS
jgi:hypothetical protein